MRFQALVRDIQAAALELDASALEQDPVGQAPAVIHLGAATERLLTAIDEAVTGPVGEGRPWPSGN